MKKLFKVNGENSKPDHEIIDSKRSNIFEHPVLSFWSMKEKVHSDFDSAIP